DAGDREELRATALDPTDVRADLAGVRQIKTKTRSARLQPSVNLVTEGGIALDRVRHGGGLRDGEQPEVRSDRAPRCLGLVGGGGRRLRGGETVRERSAAQFDGVRCAVVLCVAQLLGPAP